MRANKRAFQYAGNMKFSRYTGTTPTIIIAPFGMDCKDVAGYLLSSTVGKGRKQNLFYMIERCYVSAICKGGRYLVAVNGKRGAAS